MHMAPSSAVLTHADDVALTSPERQVGAPGDLRRKQLRAGGEAALEGKAPGRKPTRDDRDRLIEKLEREKAQLAKKLLIAEKVIELQGKAHEILGIALPRVEDGEKS